MKHLPLLTLPALLVSLCLKAQTTSVGIRQVGSSFRQTGQPETTIRSLGEGPDQKRAVEKIYMLVLQTNQSRGENEVRLPYKLDAKTLAVSAGGTSLSAGKDYVFLPDLNRLRILNQGVLASDERLYISYRLLF